MERGDMKIGEDQAERLVRHASEAVVTGVLRMREQEYNLDGRTEVACVRHGQRVVSGVTECGACYLEKSADDQRRRLRPGGYEGEVPNIALEVRCNKMSVKEASLWEAWMWAGDKGEYARWKRECEEIDSLFLDGNKVYLQS